MDLLAKRYLIISHISSFFNMQIQDYRQKKEFDVPGTVFHLKRAPLSAISGDDQGEIDKPGHAATPEIVVKTRFLE